MAICSDHIADQFDCLAVTLEMPYKVRDSFGIRLFVTTCIELTFIDRYVHCIIICPSARTRSSSVSRFKVGQQPVARASERPCSMQSTQSCHFYVQSFRSETAVSVRVDPTLFFSEGLFSCVFVLL